MQKEYSASIDGLRAIAVLSVLLYHLSPNLPQGGFVGVDIFFVISGFLITRIIFNDIKAGQFSLSEFYAHRMRRIFPALFVMLIFSSLGAVIFFGPTPFYDFFKAFRYASFQGSNFLFAREVDYFQLNADPSPLLHTWSLGVESQFYLIWPILLILAKKWIPQKWIAWLLFFITLASLGASSYFVETNSKVAFYMLPSRAWELSIGGLIAILATQTFNPRLSIYGSWIGLFLIAGSILFSQETHFPGIAALPVCLGTAIIIFSGYQSPGILHRILSTPILNFTGRISYSLYLWHWTIIIFYKSYFETNPSIEALIGLGALSYAVSMLSYEFVEKPTRHIKWKPRNIIIIGILTVIVFVLFSNFAKRAEKASWRMINHLDEQTVTANPYYDLCAKEGGAYDTNACIIGPNKEKYEVILTGDSHAAHFIPTVLGWAKSRGLTTRIFLRGNCRTFVQEDRPVIHQGKEDTYCIQLTKDFYKTLQEDKSHIQYIFTSLFLPKGDVAIGRAFSQLATFQKKVYYLGDAAIFDHHPIECEIKNSLLISKIFPRPQINCFTINDKYVDEKFSKSMDTLIPLLEKSGVRYIDFRNDMKIPFDNQGHFLFMDDNHMNNYGGTFFIPALIRHLKE